MNAQLFFAENELRIDEFRHYAEDAAAGNPCNTLLRLTVRSGEFAGSGMFTCDIAGFRRFSEEMAQMYAFRRDCAEIADLDYGSRLTLRMSRTGQMTVSGTVFGHAAEQSLTFTFDADQTALLPFSAAITALAESSH